MATELNTIFGTVVHEVDQVVIDTIFGTIVHEVDQAKIHTVFGTIVHTLSNGVEGLRHFPGDFARIRDGLMGTFMNRIRRNQ